MYEYYNKNREQDQFIWKGKYFYPDDFLDLGTSDAIRQSLTRLCKDEKIVRGGLRNLLLSSN